MLAMSLRVLIQFITAILNKLLDLIWQSTRISSADAKKETLRCDVHINELFSPMPTPMLLTNVVYLKHKAF